MNQLFGLQHRGDRLESNLSKTKNIPPKAVFSQIYLYFCHVIDDFACLDLQH